MLKVILDTNQFVSALISKKGAPAKLLQAWKNRSFILITSQDIIEEIQHVLQYPHITKKYHLKKEYIESLINLIEHEAVVLSDSIPLNVIKEDPSDNKFLACAIESEADYIISGDKHLLNLCEYKNIPIITVQNFLEKLNKL